MNRIIIEVRRIVSTASSDVGNYYIAHGYVSPAGQGFREEKILFAQEFNDHRGNKPFWSLLDVLEFLDDEVEEFERLIAIESDERKYIRLSNLRDEWKKFRDKFRAAIESGSLKDEGVDRAFVSRN